MDTISKRYSACGGRVGAFITRNRELLDTVMKFAQARLSPPSFAQILGEAAIDLPEDYFNTTREEYRLRRDLLVKRLNDMPGVFCPNPGGAFYAIARLPVRMQTGFASGCSSPFPMKAKLLCWHQLPDSTEHRAWVRRKCGLPMCLTRNRLMPQWIV